MPDSSTPDRPPEQKPAGPRSAAERQEELLRRVADLARSVERLASGVPPAPSVDAGPPPFDPDIETRRRVEFAYLFVGEVLGRRGVPVFGVPRAEATRDGRGLTFTQLRGGKAARIRAANGATDLVEGLVVGTPAQIAIPDEQPIDSIVVLESRDGVAVALGPCLDRLFSIP